MEVVGRVEDRRVAVGHRGVERQEFSGYLVLGDRRVDARQKLDRPLDPHAPMAEQPALDAHGALAAIRRHGEGDDEVEDDVIVVAGVERDPVGGIRLDDAAHHVEGR